MPNLTPVAKKASRAQVGSRCPIVGVGASAGGLEAFELLLGSLPPDTGYAFVLVQHLGASHSSDLSDILGRATTMPVVEAQDKMTVAPNHVYVIAPNTELTVAGGVLRLAPRSRAVPHMAIDRFLQSLAADCETQAVGVVLSGNGSDGAMGLLAVKEAGGLTFAQEPGSAKFVSMPCAAIAAGAADLVYRPESIATELVRFAHRPDNHAAGSSTSAGFEVPFADESFRAVCDAMLKATGIDFLLYRRTTIERRILRRIAIVNMTNVDEYLEWLRDSPDECNALRRDLLVGVTSFFRDPEAFDVLKRLVFPAIIRNRPEGATIRIWVPGCASGEEAYSILIALQEFQLEAGTAFPVQLFASDINDTALEKARNGRYPESLGSDLSPERLSEFFVKIKGAYQVVKSLRERCLFSHHNLLDDPPFSKLDLVSCRNVLIYLDTVQRKVIPLFHYALVAQGFLMLGRAERTRHDELFAAIDPIHRIYAKREVTKRAYESFARGGRSVRVVDGAGGAAPELLGRGTAELSHDVDRLLLAKYNPTGVVVDESLQVLEFRGRPAPFFGPTAGKAGLHLLKHMPDTELFLTVEKLVQELLTTTDPVRQESVAVDVDGRPVNVNIEVTSLQRGTKRAFLVLLGAVDQDASGGVPAAPPSPAISDARVAKLARELAAARARLVSFIDGEEVSNDENERIAEDALSANEELQSLAEELETAKEELQSTNEELLSVNRELESRNTGLASALELTRSIVQSVAIPFIVVDNALLVRQMNPAFLSTFPMPSGSAGVEKFYDLCEGAWDIPALRTRLERLLAGGHEFDPVEIQLEFSSLGPRALIVSGVLLEQLGWILLTVQDISDQRKAEEALRASEDQRRESEKMETVGRLAGGVAHDFNNLLTVIIANADFLARAEGLGQEELEEVSEIRDCAGRAAELTDQLLSFSRRKLLKPMIFDLNPLIVDSDKMLRRLLGERITIVVRLDKEACLVTADPAEIGRVVLNLCLNARDSMPLGGSLTIENTHVALDESEAAQRGIPPGQYVRLVVRDTGAGMDCETRRHLFEPFFTTKDVGKGVGLGLATVLGIVQQSGGFIDCSSEPGRGARFEVLLPAATNGEHATERRSGVPKNVQRAGSAVVLLVEDEARVRRVTKTALAHAGYTVLEAKDGSEALSVLESASGPIDILLSDVVMPNMSGGALIAHALKLRPDLRVLLVSGYTQDLLVKEGVANGTAFLAKPYAPADLVRKVGEILDAS